jgi:hypothetical protein
MTRLPAAHLTKAIHVTKLIGAHLIILLAIRQTTAHISRLLASHQTRLELLTRPVYQLLT